MSPIRSHPVALASVGLICLGLGLSEPPPEVRVRGGAGGLPAPPGGWLVAPAPPTGPALRVTAPPGPARRVPAALGAARGVPAIPERARRVPAASGPTLRPPPAPAPQDAYGARPHEFTFTRAVYTSAGGYGWGRRRRSWATDYPKADRQFIALIQRLVGFDIAEAERAIRLDDPELRRHPFLYAVEVGHMSLTDAEVRGLRDYLLAGGFLVVDDFWGSVEWRNFEREIRRVLPERPIVELHPDHPVFRTYYEIDEVVQVPGIGNALRGGRTWERDGYVPAVRGIHDEAGRLMVLIHWNTDLGDAWEWAEHPGYPLRYSSWAYEMGANQILYAMSR